MSSENHMASQSCHVIYLDRRARESRTFTRSTPPPSFDTPSSLSGSTTSLDSLAEEVDANISSLLSTFPRVYVYKSGLTCSQCIKSISPVTAMDEHVILLIDLPYENEQRLSTELGSHTSTDLYGMHFLAHIIPQIQGRKLAAKVIPIALVGKDAPSIWTEGLRSLGALDVIHGPLSSAIAPAQVQELIEHAHSVNQTSRERRFTSMTQTMIARLMDDLCNPSRFAATLVDTDLAISPTRSDSIARAFGSWDFSSLEFNDEELLYGVLLILQHALKHPELEKWRMTKDELIRFLIATREGYNSSVIYHNFRHACDVMQAVFYFLVANGAIPPLVEGGPTVDYPQSSFAALVRPIHALTLLIAAIGHDVGHPGVNNVFLVKVNATVARLYNDHSVLESYHCAASSQILQRFWPAASSDLVMRKLMINTILATDMTLHSQYTVQLDTLQKKFAQNGRKLVEDDDKIEEKDRELVCCLLIKCADICNVARTFNIAKDWAGLVTDEFIHQGKLEQDAAISSCLFGGPPTAGDVADLAKRQMGFMNIFAHDLFSRMSDILPAMQFTVDNINANKAIWQRILTDEQERLSGVANRTVESGPTENLEPQEVIAEQAHRTQSAGDDIVRPGQPQEVPSAQVEHQQIASIQPQAVRPAPPATPEENVSKDESMTSLSCQCPVMESITQSKAFDVREHDIHSQDRHSVDSHKVDSRRSSVCG